MLTRVLELHVSQKYKMCILGSLKAEPDVNHVHFCVYHPVTVIDTPIDFMGQRAGALSTRNGLLFK